MTPEILHTGNGETHFAIGDRKVEIVPDRALPAYLAYCAGCNSVGWERLHRAYIDAKKGAA